MLTADPYMLTNISISPISFQFLFTAFLLLLVYFLLFRLLATKSRLVSLRIGLQNLSH